jgi:hypothetical protein
MYTSQYPETVSHLILLNSLYGGSTEHPMLVHGSSSEDPQHPGRRTVAAIVVQAFGAEIPIAIFERDIRAKSQSHLQHSLMQVHIIERR